MYTFFKHDHNTSDECTAKGTDSNPPESLPYKLFFKIDETHQKSFGEPNQQRGVIKATAMSVQSHEERLTSKLSKMFWKNVPHTTMKTHPVPNLVMQMLTEVM